jgi:hypothetical protein
MRANVQSIAHMARPTPPAGAYEKAGSYEVGERVWVLDGGLFS